MELRKSKNYDGRTPDTSSSGVIETLAKGTVLTTFAPLNTYDELENIPYIKVKYGDKIGWVAIRQRDTKEEYLVVRASGGGQGGQNKIETLDSKGLNLIANMERNLSIIEYDLETRIILSIPTILPDVGYGHDVNQRPMNPIPDRLTAKAALELLKKDMLDFERPIATGINANLTQNQFNALVSLRYNIGSLGVVNGLLEYLESGSYKRTELKNLVISYYDAIIIKNPENEKYRYGWYNRTEKFLDVFFDGNYGKMPIDAVNGIVILN